MLVQRDEFTPNLQSPFHEDHHLASNNIELSRHLDSLPHLPRRQVIRASTTPLRSLLFCPSSLHRERLTMHAAARLGRVPLGDEQTPHDGQGRKGPLELGIAEP